MFQIQYKIITSSECPCFVTREPMSKENNPPAPAPEADVRQDTQRVHSAIRSSGPVCDLHTHPELFLSKAAIHKNGKILTFIELSVLGETSGTEPRTRLLRLEFCKKTR